MLLEHHICGIWPCIRRLRGKLILAHPGKSEAPSCKYQQLGGKTQISFSNGVTKTVNLLPHCHFQSHFTIKPHSNVECLPVHCLLTFAYLCTSQTQRSRFSLAEGLVHGGGRQVIMAHRARSSLYRSAVSHECTLHSDRPLASTSLKGKSQHFYS